MGFGMTFGKFLHHLFTEPLVALEGLTHSAKDVIEILFFYFSKQSLTACYVILFVIAVRFLLKKTPKIYSYALWSIVYFKLVSVFKFKIPDISLVPQAEIDKIYYDITPEYNAFYSSEAGIVSQVESNFVASVPAVTPIYIPALIWFVVLCVIIGFSAFSYIRLRHRIKNSSKNNIADNIYICNAVSSPFVLEFISPKIYLPEGLTEQQQNYIITHEKTHIKRGDHIIKLFAFCITCIHWFNPIVWLSFFLMEKDMEMSCDERVLDKIGYNHKKEYSHCILSLATDKRFKPKAYLSFGDSDTKNRIKNVLNYKKAGLWVGVIAFAVVICAVLFMFSEDRYVLPPDYNESSSEITENNFPNGYDSLFLTFAADQTTIGVNLPEGWYLAGRNIQTDEYSSYLTLDDNFSDVVDIYNNKDENVGAMGFLSYTEYLGNEANINAIYSPLHLGSMYFFDLSDENYHTVEKNTDGLWEKATTKVYHSPQLNRDLGYEETATYGDGILAYDRKTLSIVAFEFEENCFSQGELNYIASSLQIKPNSHFDSVAATVINMQYRNMETGANFDISEYVSEDVLALLKAKETIAKHRIKVFGIGKQSYNIEVIPVERESWVETENSADIKLQVIRTYRYNTSNSDSTSSEVISLHLEKYKDGKFRVTDYRNEGKDLTFADMDKDYWDAVAQGKGAEFLDAFVEEYNNFLSNLSSTPLVDKSNLTPFPVVKQWKINTKCAAASTNNNYVITYWDEKITCETGLLTVDNQNNFDIKVHLIGSAGGEITLDVLQNSAVAFALNKSSTKYTVGIHADVEEDTEIKLIISENEHTSGMDDDSVKAAIAKLSDDADVVDTLFLIAQQYGYSAPEIEQLYANAPWDYIKNQLGEGRSSSKVKTILDMFIEGKTAAEIQQFVMDDMDKKGFSEDNIKSLTRIGYSPIEIYCMTDSYVVSIFESYDKSNQPGGANRILMYEEVASQIFNSYKSNLIECSDSLQTPPADFVFPENIDWNVTKFTQDEMGYYNANIISADGKYRMVISVNDNTYDGENIFDDVPVINYVAFFDF